MNERVSWDQFYLHLADEISNRSKDESAHIGAILVKDNAVISMGYNGFPRGVDESITARHERPAKYAYTEHGERNAIYNAAKQGIATQGATMYTQGFPCADCARACIQAGIVKVVAYWQADDTVFSKWKDSCGIGSEMLREAKIELIERRDLYKAQ